MNNPKDQKVAGRRQEGSDRSSLGNGFRGRGAKRVQQRLTASLSEEYGPADIELKGWSQDADTIVAINTYPNGVTFSVHSAVAGSDKKSGKATKEKNLAQASNFYLRLKDTRDYQTPDGRVFLFRDSLRDSIRAKLRELRKSARLSKAVVYIGTVNDPYSSLAKKLDITQSILGLFNEFPPAKILLQTRSPMVMASLPLIKTLSDKLTVVIPLETSLESVIAKYTPGQSSVRQRLTTAQGLRQQGIQVDLCVSPILPYGEFYRGAWDFAEILERHADYVSMGCLASGSSSDERQLRSMPLALKIAKDKQFHWLRPHAYRHLYHALSYICPAKLRIPAPGRRKRAQLNLFAA